MAGQREKPGAGERCPTVPGNENFLARHSLVDGSLMAWGCGLPPKHFSHTATPSFRYGRFLFTWLKRNLDIELQKSKPYFFVY